jgi:nucleoid DNA-binding protein
MPFWCSHLGVSLSRSINLTTAVLRQKVAKRTGLPEHLVGQVLDVAFLEMQAELIQQGTVKLRGLFSVSTTVRRLGGKALEHGVEGKRLMLTIKPHKSFRDRLNGVLLR